MKKFDSIIIAAALTLFTNSIYADVAPKKEKSHAAKKTVNTNHNASNKADKKKPFLTAVEPALIKQVEESEESPLTGSLTLTTNYMNRGVSQSNNLPAVQGSMTYTFIPTGIYFNLWASNVDQTALDESTATIEIDTLAGITNNIGEHFSYNLAFARYSYPKATQLNYNEVIANITCYFLTGTVAYSANEFNVHAPGIYYNGGVKFDLPSKNGYFENMTIAAVFGRYDLPKDAGNSYNDYSVTLGKEIKNYNLALQWTNTNHKFLDNSLDHGHLVGSVTANF